MSGPEVGDQAPDFTLPGVEGIMRRDYTLSDYRGQTVVLAFYPGDFTPGCTKQMCQYRDAFEEFEGVEAVLLGISPQDVDSHERWIEKRHFPFPLLADTDKKVIDAYGVRGFGPIAVKRSTFVIDGEGIVRHRRSASLGMSWDKPGQLADIVRSL
jgi:thioredoxin-dependent peroxiredoxin